VPRIQADTSRIELGTLYRSKAVILESYTLRNSGDADLRITDVVCSWECGSGGKKEVNLSPGETWELPVQINLEEQAGVKLHRVVVLSNDPERPEIELKICGTFQDPITVDPPNGHFFGNVTADETRRKVLTVANHTTGPMDLKLIRSVGKTFTAQVEAVHPGKEYRLTITASPPFQPNVNVGMLELGTGLDVQPLLVIRPQATLPPRLLFPAVLTVPQPLVPGTTRVLSVRNNGDQPVTVLSAAVALDGVSVQITPVARGKVHNLNVRFERSITLPPEGSELVIRTDDKEFPTLRVHLAAEEIPTDPD
jgi:hypothetical protein